MKKIDISLFIILISFPFLLLSCNEERQVNIGQGYYYIPFQETTFDVTMFGGNGIFRYEDSLILPIVFPDIIGYRYTSDYVIVKQKFDFSETSALLRGMIFHPIYFNYNKDFVPFGAKYVSDVPQLNSSSLEAEYVDSIMHIDSHIQKMMAHTENYYIIDKMKQKLMGPFTKAEFTEKRGVLHLSDKLKFE